jgi:hypothetical protein
MELKPTITRRLALAFTATAMMWPAQPAHAQRSAYWEMAKAQAAATGVPESLVHRVIMRESKYQANLVGRGNTIGLMQIKLPTARGVGYRGDATGLRNPETNLIYGVRYLAGAYRMAGGNHDRAVGLYARGYNYNARRYGSLTAIQTASASSKSATVEPTQTQPSEQSSETVAALPTKRVPIPRGKPDAMKQDVANTAPIKPESITPEMANARASLAEQLAAAPRERPPEQNAPEKSTLAKLWDGLTGWARR